MPKASPKSWHEALSTLQLWVRMGEALWLRHDILWFKRKSFLHKLSLAWLSPKPNYIVGAAARKFAWWLVWTLVWRGVRRSSSSILDSFRAMPNKGYTTFGSAQYHYILHIIAYCLIFASFYVCLFFSMHVIRFHQGIWFALLVVLDRSRFGFWSFHLLVIL